MQSERNTSSPPPPPSPQRENRESSSFSGNAQFEENDYQYNDGLLPLRKNQIKLESITPKKSDHFYSYNALNISDSETETKVKVKEDEIEKPSSQNEIHHKEEGIKKYLDSHKQDLKDAKNADRDDKVKESDLNKDIGEFRGETDANGHYVSGTMNYFNGDQYIGEWSNQFPNGLGQYSWKSGQFFEGSFKNGHPNGWGSMTLQSGGIIEGNFADKIPHGYIKFQVNSEVSIAGRFVNGKAQGLFHLKWSDKTVHRVVMKDSKTDIFQTLRDLRCENTPFKPQGEKYMADISNFCFEEFRGCSTHCPKNRCVSCRTLTEDEIASEFFTANNLMRVDIGTKRRLSEQNLSQNKEQQLSLIPKGYEGVSIPLVTISPNFNFKVIIPGSLELLEVSHLGISFEGLQVLPVICNKRVGILRQGPGSAYTYKGELVKHKRAGRGVEYLGEDHTFEGFFVDDQRHGKGVEVLNGRVLMGRWIKGKKNGIFFEKNEIVTNILLFNDDNIVDYSSLKNIVKNNLKDHGIIDSVKDVETGFLAAFQSSYMD